MDLRYPIGKFEPQPFSYAQRDAWIHDIEMLPDILQNTVKNFDEEKFNTPYREGGWTASQVIHHLADSHINAYVRIKLALTEDAPVVCLYKQNEWVMLPDANVALIRASLDILKGVHQHFVTLFKSLSDEQWQLKFIHPQFQEPQTLWDTLGKYAWHGKHHTAHIMSISIVNSL